MTWEDAYCNGARCGDLAVVTLAGCWRCQHKSSWHQCCCQCWCWGQRDNRPVITDINPARAFQTCCVLAHFIVWSKVKACSWLVKEGTLTNKLNSRVRCASGIIYVRRQHPPWLSPKYALSHFGHLKSSKYHILGVTTSWNQVSFQWLGVLT